MTEHPISWLTQAELDAVQHLHRRAPYQVQFVSSGMLSVARYSGACTFQGCMMVYFAGCDSLVRDDVLAFVNKMRRGANPPKPASVDPMAGFDLFASEFEKQP